MNKLFPRGIIALCFFSVATTLLAVDFQQFSNQVRNRSLDETNSRTLLGIMESCGSGNSLDDNCVIQNLNRVTEEESNSTAQAIMADYEKALSLGSYNDIPECQSDINLQVNRNIGHCVLLLNYYALKSPNLEEANMQYLMCLQGAMLGLAYEGNLSAQLLLSQIFEQRGIADTAVYWRKALEQRKGTEEYNAVMKCYQRS